MKRIIKGDTVIVSAGKSKGHIGKILKVLADEVIVEGANVIKKAVKPNPQLNQDGGIISMEAPLHVSNVALYDATLKKAGKVGFKVTEEGKVRYLSLIHI